MANKNNYIDVYEQLIDEDPAGGDYLELPHSEDKQAALFEEIEEKAYEDLADQTKKGRLINRGGSIRTQEKRPFSQKFATSF